MPLGYLQDEKKRKKRISNYIRGEMKEKKISQKAMGEELGIEQSSISKKISQCSFTVSELIKVFIFLGTTKEEAGEMLGGEK